ncbi:MAG: hypothetical protein SOZ51_08395, partial [Eubacteriales bacterium]|nr:hypothetical protein [Eubacteriales bacterium]
MKERFRNPKNFPEKGVLPSFKPAKSDMPQRREDALLREVLWISKPFFQERFRRGLGRSPKVFPTPKTPITYYHER